jgi:hypothetical protein
MRDHLYGVCPERGYHHDEMSVWSGGGVDVSNDGRVCSRG